VDGGEQLGRSYKRGHVPILLRPVDRCPGAAEYGQMPQGSAALLAGVILAVCGGAFPREQPARAAVEGPLLAVSAWYGPASTNEIQLVGLDGRRARVDPHPPSPFDGTWSPDGTRIAFTGWGADKARGLYVMNPTGTRVRLLFRPPEPADGAFLPSWSPDGRRLAFAVDEKGPWIVSADGRGARPLARLGMHVFSGAAAWSSDGGTLAFGAYDAQGGSALYAIRVNGTGLRRLTRKPTLAERAGGAPVSDPTWSPDGNRIAFARYADGRAPRIEVVMPGGRERVLARGQYPAWSPDGRRLAFYATGGVGLVSADGGRPRLIARVRARRTTAVWTAGGKLLLLFVRQTPYVIDPNGGGARRLSLTERRRLRLAPPAQQWWSRDGKFLDTEGDFNQGSGASPAHGNAVARILTLRGVPATFRWSTDSAPAWAPDGRRLAFVRTAQTNEIYVIDASGGRPRRLATGHNPVWSPDGMWIAFERRRGVWVIASAGGRARLIAPGRNPAWSPDSRWLAFANTGVFSAPMEGGPPHLLLAPRRLDCFGEPVSFLPDWPAWSHDGRSLAFGYHANADCNWVLAVASSDGDSPRSLTDGSHPQWTPDDSHLVFLDHSDLGLVAASGQDRRTLADDFVESFSTSSDGGLIAYERLGEIWIVQATGQDRRTLLRKGLYADPAWAPG
jgi:Tol biopolymer transport system component